MRYRDRLHAAVCCPAVARERGAVGHFCVTTTIETVCFVALPVFFFLTALPAIHAAAAVLPVPAPPTGAAAGGEDAVSGPGGPALRTVGPVLEANFTVARVGTVDVPASEVLPVFRDIVAQEAARRHPGAAGRKATEAEIARAWRQAVDQAVEDALLLMEAEKVRDRIREMVVGAALARNAMFGDEAQAPEIAREQAERYFERLVDDEVRRAIREYTEDAGGEAAVRGMLERRRMTRSEWERKVRRDIFVAYFVAHEMGPATESPRESRAFYERHPELFDIPERWRLRRIAVDKSKYPSPEVAMHAARMIRERLLAGADFAEVAAAVGDGGSAENGGLLSGDGSADVTAEDFPLHAKAAAMTEVGGISDIYEDEKFLYILKVEGRKPGRRPPFEEVEWRAAALARAEAMRRRRAELFEKLRGRTLIKILCPDPPPHIVAAILERQD
ncbi:MAG: peptidylprolyl isomerase [Planctomycetota bacterium]|nr:peptidylprolyl isomerase [Planctomycetota bacterium]